MNLDNYFAQLAKELCSPDLFDDDEPRADLRTTEAAPTVSDRADPGTIETATDDADEPEIDPRPRVNGYDAPREDAAELRTAIANTTALADGAEALARSRTGQRQRARDDRERHRAQIGAIVIAAAKALQRGCDFRIPLRNTVLKGKRTRYSDPVLSPNLRTVTQLLLSEGFIVKTQDAERPISLPIGFSPGRAAGYSAGPRLAPLLSDVSLTDICRIAGDEVILLKSRRDEVSGVSDLIDYKDKATPAHINEARRELIELNAFRERADIQCLGSPARFDVSDRHSRRRWTRGSWDCGGRHWGGFWQTMRKAERLNLIEIEGEPVTGIDYVGTVVTLAYAAMGLQLPEGDPYAFTLVDKNGAAVETTRKQRKVIFIASMNGAKDWLSEMRAEFRHRISWRRTVDCLKERHAAIAWYFDADRGQQLAATEANIMAAVLKALRLQGVVALDMFDCVLVKRSALAVAREVMLSEFQRIAGQPARVSVEEPESYPLVAPAPIELEDF